MRSTNLFATWTATLLLGISAQGESVAAQTLERMKSLYQTRLSEFTEANTTKIGEVETRYARSLDELVSQVQSQGLLDALIYLRAHRDGYVKTKSVPESPDPSAPPALARLQQGYWSALRDVQREHETRTAEMVRAYLSRLDQLKRELTIQGKLNDAMLFLQEFNAVSATPEGLAAMAPQPPRDTPAHMPAQMVGRIAQWPWNIRGLQFFWADGRQPINGADARGVVNRTFTLSATGDCRTTDRMVFREGRIVVEDAGADIARACRDANAFSLVSSIKTTEEIQKGPARIVTLSSGSGDRNFTLGHSNHRLILRLRTSRSPGANGTEVELMRLRENREYRIVLRYEPGNLRMHVDGNPVDVPSIDGTLDPWEASHRLVFGNEWKDDRAWRGELRNVAIFSRFLDDAEAQRLSLP